MDTQLKELVENAYNIVFITGAGISTNTGIPDFRSQGGIYNSILTGLLNTKPMLRYFPGYFYKKMARPYAAITAARPTKAHKAIAELQNGHNVTVLTQNIDGLHQAAGSTNVLELHGDMQHLRWIKCGKLQPRKMFHEDLLAGRVPKCDCGGHFRPTFTLFQEPLPTEPLRRGMLALLDADLVIVCGTSLKVSPVNKLPGYRVEGTPLVIINNAPTCWDQYADLVIHADIDSALD